MSERGLQVRLEHERIWDVRYWKRRVSSKENYMNSPIPPPERRDAKTAFVRRREDEHTRQPSRKDTGKPVAEMDFDHPGSRGLWHSWSLVLGRSGRRHFAHGDQSAT